jgi:hypothetical protein
MRWRRPLDTGHLVARQAEAPLPAREIAQRSLEFGLVEIGPERVAEIELGVGQVPEQEIADALLAARADEEIGFRRAGQLQFAANEGRLVDRNRLERRPAARARPGAALPARCPSDRRRTAR